MYVINKDSLIKSFLACTMTTQTLKHLNDTAGFLKNRLEETFETCNRDLMNAPSSLKKHHLHNQTALAPFMSHPTIIIQREH